MNKTIILAFSILTLVSLSGTNSPVYLDNGKSILNRNWHQVSTANFSILKVWVKR